MDEITSDLLKLFAGENIDKMEWLGEDIYFFVDRLDIDSGQIETYPRSITESDLKDIEDVFIGGLRFRPVEEYILLILWIREVKFKIDSLLESDGLDFVKNAFTLNCIPAKTDTIKLGFRKLLSKGYISEEITEVEGHIGKEFTGVGRIKEYFLSLEGKRVAEEMFDAMKKLVNAPIESPPIALEEDSADCHLMTHAASGRGVSKPAVEAHQESIEWADEPAEVVVKNEVPISVRDDQIIELLKKQNSLIEKGTTVNRKGFDSLKPKDHQSLAELVKTLPGLTNEREDENWVTAQTVEKLTGEPLGNLNKQRQRGEHVLFEGFEYGRDTEGRIWCCVRFYSDPCYGDADYQSEDEQAPQQRSRKTFYLTCSLSGQSLSR